MLYREHCVIKKVFVILLVVATLMICNPASPAHAYSHNGGYLSHRITFLPHSSFGATTVSHFNEALYQWNYHSGRTLMARSTTTYNTSLVYPHNDQKSGIYRQNACTDYVAQCTRYPANGAVNSADININPYYRWANSAQPNCYDVWSVFLHEAGHAAGLGHSSNSNAVMYAYVYTNSVHRYLHSDDIAGIQALY